jgi:hypothetical protein
LKPPEALSRIKEDKLTAPHEVRSSVSLEVSMAIMKGLAVRPEQRPGTAEEFSSLLGGTLTAEEPNTSTQTTGVTRRPDEESFEPALEEKPEQAVDEQSEDAEVEGHHNLLSFSQTKIQAVALVLVGLAAVALLWGAFGGASSGPDSEDQSGLGVTPEWRNRVEMLVGVKSLPQAFLDSLITTVKRREDPWLYRTPDKRRGATLEQLQSSLSEDGVSFTTSDPGVTHAFVEYEVRSYGSAVAERFVSLHLIRRPGSGREDVDVLYLDTESELLGGLLKKKGPQLANRPDHETFRRELSLASILLRGAFTRLSWQQPGQLAITALGELGGVTVREGGKSEPIRRLQRRVLDAVYESDVRYVLE